ncbi:MAG: CAP domain-containing protein [Deltaproteobacteria bacterium]|nr:CAP domain-containing protein [Deltaproteobacteria bacterium]
MSFGFLLVFGLIILGGGLNNSSAVSSGRLILRNSHPPQIYFTEPFTLRPSPVILGWDTEEIKPTDIIRLVNDERAKADSPILRENAELDKAAEMRVETIFKNRELSHLDPIDHVQLDTVLPRVNYYFAYASENIGLAQDEAKGIVRGFMSSPPHRENLLNPKLVETGVGVRKGQFKGNYVVIVVQIFAIPTSREEYFGYSEADKATVKGLIDGVDGQLRRTEGFLAGDPNSQYYGEWKKVLTEQGTRLSEVYNRMLSGLPFTQEQYDLVAAYNNGWKNAPK